MIHSATQNNKGTLGLFNTFNANLIYDKKTQVQRQPKTTPQYKIREKVLKKTQQNTHKQVLYIVQGFS